MALLADGTIQTAPRREFDSQPDKFDLVHSEDGRPIYYRERTLSDVISGLVKDGHGDKVEIVVEPMYPCGLMIRPAVVRYSDGVVGKKISNTSLLSIRSNDSGVSVGTAKTKGDSSSSSSEHDSASIASVASSKTSKRSRNSAASTKSNKRSKPTRTPSITSLDFSKLRALSELISPIVIRGFSGSDDRDVFIDRANEMGTPLPWKNELILEVKDLGEKSAGSGNSLSSERMPFHYDGVFKTRIEKKTLKSDDGTETVEEKVVSCPPRYVLSPLFTPFVLFTFPS